MAKSDLDTAVAAEKTQGRSPMGTEGVAFTSPSAKPVSGTLEPRKNTQAGDPAIEAKPARANVPYKGEERTGAAYSIKASYAPQTSPEAGLTQANGRIIPPKTVRSRGGFDQGIGTSY